MAGVTNQTSPSAQTKEIARSPGEAANSARPPKLLEQLREALRSRHYSRRTEQTYILWVRRFIFHNNLKHPAEMDEANINAFLTHLAVKKESERINSKPGAMCPALFVSICNRPQSRRSRGGHPGPEVKTHPCDIDP
jgi:hypothetical protein